MRTVGGVWLVPVGSGSSLSPLWVVSISSLWVICLLRGSSLSSLSVSSCWACISPTAVESPGRQCLYYPNSTPRTWLLNSSQKSCWFKFLKKNYDNEPNFQNQDTGRYIEDCCKQKSNTCTTVSALDENIFCVESKVGNIIQKSGRYLLYLVLSCP